MRRPLVPAAMPRGSDVTKSVAFSLRTKLIAAFLIVAGIPLVTVWLFQSRGTGGLEDFDPKNWPKD